jgi:hypothetical protein
MGAPEAPEIGIRKGHIRNTTSTYDSTQKRHPRTSIYQSGVVDARKRENRQSHHHLSELPPRDAGEFVAA